MQRWVWATTLSVLVSIAWATSKFAALAVDRNSRRSSNQLATLPAKFIVCPLSFSFQKAGISATIRLEKEEPRLWKGVPLNFQLAEIAGAALIVHDPNPSGDASYRGLSLADLVRAFRANGYSSWTGNDPHTYYVAPKEFDGPLEQQDEILAQTLGVAFERSFSQIDEDRADAGRSSAEISKLSAEATQIANLLKTTNEQIASTQTQITNLQNELNRPLPPPRTDRKSGGFSRFESIMKPPYDKRRDYLGGVITDNLERIPYDAPYLPDAFDGNLDTRGPVTWPFLDQDMIDALDKLTTEGKPELDRLGVKIELESAARTPLQQSKTNAPVKATNFGTGHATGHSVDLHGLAYREAIIHGVKPTAAAVLQWEGLKKVLGKYGLVINDPRDPNHVTLAKFINDKQYRLQKQTKMLQAYVERLKMEQSDANQAKTLLREGVTSVMQRNGEQNALLKQAQGRLGQLQAQLNQLGAQVQARNSGASLGDKARDDYRSATTRESGAWSRDSNAKFTRDDTMNCKEHIHEDSRGNYEKQVSCERGSGSAGMKIP